MSQQGSFGSLPPSNGPSCQPLWAGADDLQGIIGHHEHAPTPSYPDSPNSLVGSNLGGFLQLYPIPGDRMTHERSSIGSIPPLLEHRGFPYSHRSDRGMRPGSRLRGTEQDVWSPLHLTELPAMTTDRRPHIRPMPTHGLDETTSQGSQHLTSEIESQANGLHPSDSGYMTRTTSIKSGGGSASMGRERNSYRSPGGTTPGASPYDSLPPNPFLQNHSLSSNRPLLAPSRKQEQQQTCDFRDCDWTGKCPSDKKKHMQRHEKRYLCNVPGCTRKDGFGTRNDLDRHKKCVHQIDSGPRTGKYYKCFAEQCARKNRLWPRYDNFRQHLQRMHYDEGVEELIQRSEEWRERQELQQTELHPRSSEFPTQDTFRHETDSVPETAGCATGGGMEEPSTVRPAKLHPGSQASMPRGLADDPLPLVGLAEGYGRPNYTSDVLPTVCHSRDHADTGANEGFAGQTNGNQFFNDLSLSHKDFRSSETVVKSVSGLLKALDRETENIRFSKRDSGNTAPRLGIFASDPNTPSFLDLLRQSGNEERNILQRLVRVGLKHIDKTTNSSSGATHSTSEGENSENLQQLYPFLCPHEGCDRRTRRESELRKHVLRHERRYGCTFTGCNKKFGSKNDWKRHENTRHFQHQSWVCQERVRGRSPDSYVECGNVFRRRNLFAEHLRIVHKVKTNKRIKESLREGQIGRNGQVRFWCGFCQKPVSLESTGLRAWDDRYDHIDDEHFKKGQDIADWVPPESDGAGDQRRHSEPSSSTSEKTSRSVENEEVWEPTRDEHNEEPFHFLPSSPPVNQPLSYVREVPKKRQRASPSPENSPTSSTKYPRGGHTRGEHPFLRPESSASAINEANQDDQASNPPPASRTLTQKEIATSLFLTTGEPVPRFITCCVCNQSRSPDQLALQSRCPGELHPKCTICNHEFCILCKREWR